MKTDSVSACSNKRQKQQTGAIVHELTHVKQEQRLGRNMRRRYNEYDYYCNPFEMEAVEAEHCFFEKRKKKQTITPESYSRILRL